MAKKVNNFPKHYFVIPPGRLISGNLTTKNLTDMHGKPNESPNYWFAVAVPKTSPGIAEAIQALINFTFEALRTNPALGAAQCGFEPQQGYQHAPFSWKLRDGDGAKWRGKEGAANCWIFEYSTAISFVSANNLNIPIDPATINLGDWVDVATMCQFNDNAEKPGIYMNPQGVRLLGYGERINPGPSAAQLFGAAPAMLPAGASATPLATAQPGGFAQPQQQQPGAGAAPGGFQFAPVAGMPVTGAPVATPGGTAYPFNPNPGFLTGQ